jgi:hypothetical protein
MAFVGQIHRAASARDRSSSMGWRATRDGPALTSNTPEQSALQAPQRVHRDASTR